MLGAEVHPVPAVAYEHPQNYNHQARDFAQSLSNAIWTDQFDNTANAAAHHRTTGPELWAQTRGALDAFGAVSSYRHPPKPLSQVAGPEPHRLLTVLHDNALLLAAAYTGIYRRTKGVASMYR